MMRLMIFAAALAISTQASAHGGVTAEHASWILDPFVTLPLALLLTIYLVGRKRLTARSSSPRRPGWQFVGGWTFLSFALVSPLHEAGERSFTLHMIEHELIMLPATLLLAASNAGGTLVWGLPAPVRKALGGGWKAPLASVWRWLTEPVTATAVQAVVMLAWHTPALFDRALGSRGWHVAQHLSFILASLLFWWAMTHPRRGGYSLSATCLFFTSLVEGGLGALMALSQSPWYSAYAAMGMSGIGLDPTTEQQLAGLVMWIPGGAVHGAAALWLLHRWLSSEDGRAVHVR